MFCRSVIFKIHSSKTPFEILIQTCEGLSSQSIYSNFTKLHFCTKGNCVKFVAKYNKLTVCKTICLKCFCQTLCIDLDKYFPKVETSITLTDAIYNLPVTNAVLNFNQEN